MASSLLRILSGRHAEKKWLFLRALLKKTPFPLRHLSRVPPCPERPTRVLCLFPRQAGLWFFCVCAQSGAVTASPSCWKPQRPPGALPLSPGPALLKGFPWPAPLPQGTPLPLPRPLQQDSRCRVQGPFHTLTRRWGPRRAFVHVGLSVTLGVLAIGSEKFKYTCLLTCSEGAVINVSQESLFMTKPLYFPKHRHLE